MFPLKFVATEKLNIIFFKTTYPNINISVHRSANSRSLTGFLKYLPKNMILLVQNFERKYKT